MREGRKEWRKQGLGVGQLGAEKERGVRGASLKGEVQACTLRPYTAPSRVMQ